MGPYRLGHLPSWREEELWLSLDLALELSLRSPSLAYTIAWDVYFDCRGYPDVRRAASELMSALCASAEQR